MLTTNSIIQGWCNVDPAEAYAGKIKFKEECDCRYDGLWGRFCEVPVETVCINQCSRQSVHDRENKYLDWMCGELELKWRKMHYCEIECY